MPYPREELQRRLNQIVNEEKILLTYLNSAEEITNNPFAFTTNRSIITGLAYARLIAEKHYTIDQLFLPENKRLVEEMGAKVIHDMNTMSKDEFGLSYFDRMADHLEYLNNYLKLRFTPGMSPEEMLSDRNKNLFMVAAMAKETAQEIDKMKAYMYENFSPKKGSSGYVKTPAKKLEKLKAEEWAYVQHIAPYKNIFNACSIIMSGRNLSGELYAAALSTDKFKAYLAENPNNGANFVNYILDKKNYTKLFAFPKDKAAVRVQNADAMINGAKEYQKSYQDPLTHHLKGIRDDLAALKGPKDSAEYTNLINSLNKNIQAIETAQDPSDINRCLRAIEGSASKYMYGKVDQGMTKTRPRRMQCAASVARIIDAYRMGKPYSKAVDEREALLDSLAAKLIKYASGKKKISVGGFQDKIKDVRASESFKKLFEKSSATNAFLRKSLAASSKSVFDSWNKSYDTVYKEKITAEDALKRLDNARLLNPEFQSAFMKSWTDKGHSVQEFVGNIHHVRFDRSGVISLCVASMMERGFSVENIMDPKALQSEKQAAFKSVANLILNKSPEATKRISDLYVFGAKKSYELLCRIMKGADLKDPCCFLKKNTICAGFLADLAQDCTQESDQNFADLSAAAFGGADKRQACYDRVVAMSGFVENTNQAAKYAAEAVKGEGPLCDTADNALKFLRRVMAPQQERKAVFTAIKKNSKKTLGDVVLKTVRNDICYTYFNDWSGNPEIVNRISSCMSNIENCKKIAQDYLKGDFEKKYTVQQSAFQNQRTKEIVYKYDIPDIDKALEGYKPKQAMVK